MSSETTTHECPRCGDVHLSKDEPKAHTPECLAWMYRISARALPPSDRKCICQAEPSAGQ